MSDKSSITDLIRVAGWEDSGQEIWQAFGLRASGQDDPDSGQGQGQDVDYQAVNAYLDEVEAWDADNSDLVERYGVDLDRWRDDPDNVPRPDMPVLPDAPVLDVALLPIMAVASPPLAAALAVIRLLGRAYLAYRQARLQAQAQQDTLEALRAIAQAVNESFQDMSIHTDNIGRLYRVDFKAGGAVFEPDSDSDS